MYLQQVPPRCHVGYLRSNCYVQSVNQTKYTRAIVREKERQQKGGYTFTCHFYINQQFVIFMYLSSFFFYLCVFFSQRKIGKYESETYVVVNRDLLELQTVSERYETRQKKRQWQTTNRHTEKEKYTKQENVHHILFTRHDRQNCGREIHHRTQRLTFILTLK